MTETVTANATPPATLPNDVARCAGIGDDAEGWHDDCEDCMRRTSPATGDHVAHMTPPRVIVFCCPNRIDPPEAD